MQEYNPYDKMKIIFCGQCVGLIGYSYDERHCAGFVNNFFVCQEHRNGALDLQHNQCKKIQDGHMDIHICPSCIKNMRARELYVKLRNYLFKINFVSSAGSTIVSPL